VAKLADWNQPGSSTKGLDSFPSVVFVNGVLTHNRSWITVMARDAIGPKPDRDHGK